MSFITTKDGMNMYYKDWGTGQPIVFNHGWPLTADAFEDQMFFMASNGYRCVAVKRGWEVTLFSRHMKVLNRRFPNVVEALASLDSDFVLDGELVALDSQEGHHSRCCRPVLRRFFTPSIYSNKMASSW